MCVVWCSISFDLLLFRRYYSTGFSLHIEVAVSGSVHIVCNPLITGVIRDVMFTFIAYTYSITTIVSNLHIFRTGTTLAVASARSFSNDGIFHIATRISIVTGSVMNGRR